MCYESPRFPTCEATKITAHLSLRATSHMRVRARDHYTSSTLIGVKGGAGPSSLHTMLRDQRSM